MSKNFVLLVGNIGADPEVRTTTNGKKVASFSLATSETFKNKNGDKVTHTEWHRVVVWEKLAEIVEKYTSKGSQILVDGSIKYRQYDDKDGNKKYITEILATGITLLGKPGEKTKTEEPKTAAVGPDPNTDDLPF